MYKSAAKNAKIVSTKFKAGSSAIFSVQKLIHSSITVSVTKSDENKNG